MIIVVASQHGAGKSTAVNGLLEAFSGMRKLEMGKKFRELAEEKGMTIDEFSKFLASNPAESDRIDREMDDYQKREIAKGNIIVDSSLGAMAAEGADIKVLLTCNAETRAQRVLGGGKRYGDEGAGTVGEMARQLIERDKNDQERYKRLYGFDMFDTGNYDLVVDTGETTKNEVVQKIVDELKRRNPNAF
ncbi:MAG: (d)CMP kinase [Candidatus Diapherotrites archaeon]|nr:(d)CMP kinase [Candidatus Diapherotrites archaeon]